VSELLKTLISVATLVFSFFGVLRWYIALKQDRINAKKHLRNDLLALYNNTSSFEPLRDILDENGGFYLLITRLSDNVRTLHPWRAKKFHISVLQHKLHDFIVKYYHCVENDNKECIENMIINTTSELIDAVCCVVFDEELDPYIKKIIAKRKMI
jgi:hypothetical protein